MKTLILSLLTIAIIACQSPTAPEQNQKSSSASPPEYLGEPVSSEGTSLLRDNDGSIMFIFRKGDWDHGGFTDTVFYMVSRDEGRSWSDSQTLVVTPGNVAQCFSTISPETGEIIVFYIDRGTGVMSARSENNRKNWKFQEMTTPDNTSINTISYGNALWVDQGDSKRVICGFHGGGLGCGSFYSDDDGKTWMVSPRINVPNNVSNIWQTGAVEPSMVQLSDGRIMMFIRNSNFNIWKSYSSDKGATWSDPEETDFYCGDNSWITLKTMTDGRHIIVWNNAKALRPEVTLDKWNFTSREVLHMAISEDDGQSWTGFKELMLDRLKDGGFINYPGDKGLNESKLAETAEGNLLLSVGQAPVHRSFLLVDPDWLYDGERKDDFSNGLSNWSVQKILMRPAIYKRRFHHNYERKAGPVLVAHPEEEGKKVLHIRRPADTTVFSQRDGAVWNFKAGHEGEIEIDIRLNNGFKGSSISLNDRWFQPIDNQGRETAMYVLEIPPSGIIDANNKMEKDQWYTLKLIWAGCTEKNLDTCSVWLNKKKTDLELPLINPSTFGISYLRFRSATRNPDDKGMFVSSVKASVK